MQSEVRLKWQVLLVHLTAEVMSFKTRFKTRQIVTLLQLMW